MIYCCCCDEFIFPFCGAAASARHDEISADRWPRYIPQRYRAAYRTAPRRTVTRTAARTTILLRFMHARARLRAAHSCRFLSPFGFSAHRRQPGLPHSTLHTINRRLCKISLILRHLLDLIRAAKDIFDDAEEPRSIEEA
jgi:hypothetical protein